MRSWSADSTAPPAVAWRMIASPARWPEWAPHVRGAWGLGAPEVREGARGAARLLGVVPVPARITDVQHGRSWTWRVAETVTLVHRVTPRGDGCAVATELRAPAPLEAALAATYGPVIGWTMQRLASRAAWRRG